MREAFVAVTVSLFMGIVLAAILNHYSDYAVRCVVLQQEQT